MPFRKTIFLTVLSVLLTAVFAGAQEKSESDSLVRLNYGKTAELIEINGQNVRKVIGPAEFLHNNTFMLCDTALWNIDTGIIDAMGNVSLIQEGTVLTSDKMKYIVDEDLAQFRGVLVELVDSAKNVLRTSYLDYNTKDSVGVFNYGGSMRDKEGQLIESIQGTYDSKAKLFTFVDEVNMFTDSIFVKTTRLEYRSDLNFATFGRETDMWKDDNMLSADAGWYDRDNEIFFFRNNVHIMNDTQEGWSDSLYFYRNTMDVDMRGRAQVSDSTRNVSGLAGQIIYTDSLARVTMLHEPAVVARMNQDEKIDTVYACADTIMYYTMRMCDIHPSVIEASKRRVEELSGDPVGAYREQAAEARRKALEEAEKNDPNYRPPGMAQAGSESKEGEVSEDASTVKPKDEDEDDEDDIVKPPVAPATDSLAVGRDSLAVSRDSLAAGYDSLAVSRDSLAVGRDSLAVSRDSLSVGRDSLAVGRDSLGIARDSLGVIRDSLGNVIDSLVIARDSLGLGRDSLGLGRDSLAVGRDSLAVGRDRFDVIRDSLGLVRDSLGIWRDSLGIARDSLGLVIDSLAFGLDSLGVAKDSIVGPLDTTKVNFLWANGNIRMFKDGMQTVCDSLEYCDLDSLTRLYKGTVIWNEITQQYSADSVMVVFRNGAMEKANLMSESYIIIEEEKDVYFDQIKSVEAIAYFDKSGDLSRFDALGSATGAFFLREEDVVATVNKTDSKMLSAVFVNGEINKVYYFQEVKSDAYPVVQLPKEEQTFKGFLWQPERRPATPDDVTTRRPRPSMRGKYSSHPRAAFDFTEIYFPGYIPKIYVEIHQRDSLGRIRAAERREAAALREAFLADSLERANLYNMIDTLVVIDTLMFSDSLALADSLVRADKRALREERKRQKAIADSLALVDSLSKPQEEKVLTEEEIKAKLLAEKLAAKEAARAAKEAERERLRAEREAARQQRLEEKEAKWAALDSLDALKDSLLVEKKAEKQRQKKLKALEKADAINEVEEARLEKYVEKIEKQEAKKDERLIKKMEKKRAKKKSKSGGKAKGGGAIGAAAADTVVAPADTTIVATPADTTVVAPADTTIVAAPADTTATDNKTGSDGNTDNKTGSDGATDNKTGSDGNTDNKTAVESKNGEGDANNFGN